MTYHHQNCQCIRKYLSLHSLDPIQNHPPYNHYLKFYIILSINLIHPLHLINFNYLIYHQLLLRNLLLLSMIKVFFWHASLRLQYNFLISLFFILYLLFISYLILNVLYHKNFLSALTIYILHNIKEFY